MSIDWDSFTLDNGTWPHEIANEVKRVTIMPQNSSICDFFSVLLCERDAGGPAWRTAMLNYALHIWMRQACDESEYPETYERLNAFVISSWNAFKEEINRIPLSDDEEEDETTSSSAESASPRTVFAILE